MWGIIPAAGLGTRIQPLAFSKELLPVGYKGGNNGSAERPRAISEYLLDRMILAGVTKVCFVISPRKMDIVRYYSTSARPISIYYAVQPEPAGLCDAIFRARPLIAPDELAIVGLPDTIWYPAEALRSLGSHPFSFLLFPVDQPQFFDSVVTGDDERILGVYTKYPHPPSRWIWGAFQFSGSILRELFSLWRQRGYQDQYVGPLVNEFLKRGGQARGVRAGESYYDVGTLRGYREAMQIAAAAVPGDHLTIDQPSGEETDVPAG
ncbi:MAG TPA: sugar phosphate nucleotidyltransferase [Terriglobia bacterium]|nr:sugar phosphate nucleotidyltransferase [Terriglobia bacterium]